MQLELRNKRITIANKIKNNNMRRKQRTVTINDQQPKEDDNSNIYRRRRCYYGHMILLVGCCMVMNPTLRPLLTVLPVDQHFVALVSAFTINQNEKNTYRCNYQMRPLFPQQRRRIVPLLQQDQQLLQSSSLQLVGTTSTTSTTTTTTKIPDTSNRPTSSSSSSSRNDLFLPPNIQYADAVVCGGGPTGLLTAIMLAQQDITTTEGTTTKTIKRFPNIHVYDRLNTPISNPDLPMIWDGTLSNIAKFYLIGLGGRGQRALQYFHLWDTIVAPRCVSVIGRRDWTPETPNGTISIKPIRNNITTQVLPRDKLVSILYQYIMEQYSNQITCYYNTEVQPIDFYYNNCTSNIMVDDSTDNGNESVSSSSETALVRVAKCSSSTVGSSKGEDEDGTNNVSDNIMCDTDIHYVSTPLLIAADGTVRTIANTISYFDNERIQHIPRHNIIQRYMARRNAMYVKRYVDDNQRVYKTIPLKFPKDWRCDLNYSARTKRLNLEALPANRDGEYCGVLLLKHNDPIAKANTDPQELRRIFDEMIPQFSALIDDTTLASIAKKPVSYLPNFRYVGPRLHEGRCTVLLGDCAHTVKPYFGLGANSALEDVMLLSQYLSRYMNDTSKALYEFSKFRAPESKVLVRISRDLDRPGKLGFITFIGPIILDAIFQKIAPKIFLPNVITMLQRENYTFQQLAYRKRLDRMIQLSIIGTGVSVVGCTATAVVNWISKLLGVRSIYLSTSFILAAFMLNRFKATVSNQATQT